MYHKHKEIFSVKNLFKISLVLYQQFNENIQINGNLSIPYYLHLRKTL